MNLKESLVYFGAGVGGVFFGYWLLIAVDALIFQSLEPGDLATWFAACGTILTLGFLINQNHQIRKEQKKEKQDLAAERQKREAHERKQQDMWNQQQEMLTFEKFQKHKASFHSVLDQLENSLHIKFFDRDALYEELFPHNSFENCITDKANTEYLKDITMSYLGIWKHVDKVNALSAKSEHSDQLYVDYLNNINCISGKLKITLLAPHRVGNIYWRHDRQPFLSNVFDLKATIFSLESVIRRLCLFCSYEFPDIRTEPLSGDYLIPYYKFITSEVGEKLYKIDLESHNEILSVMIRVYEELDRQGWKVSTAKQNEAVEQIRALVFDSLKLVKVFSSPPEIKALLSTLQTVKPIVSPSARDASLEQLQICNMINKLCYQYGVAIM